MRDMGQSMSGRLRVRCIPGGRTWCNRLGLACCLLLAACTGCARDADSASAADLGPADAAAAERRSTADAQIDIARMFIVDLRETFEKGQLQRADTGQRPQRSDARLAILGLIVCEKLPAAILRRIDDPAVRDAALRELNEAIHYYEATILPQYNIAQESHAPEQAQALVPMLDELDRQLIEVGHAMAAGPPR